jgi:hypothetical protein
MKNPEALTFRIPRGLFRPVVGELYLYLHHHRSFDIAYVTRMSLVT